MDIVEVIMRNGVDSEMLTARRLDLPEGNRGESNSRWVLRGCYSVGKAMAHLTRWLI